MLQIDTDLDACQRDVVNFFRDQIPFAMSRAINSTAFAIRQEIIDRTWPNAFEVRNRTLPKIAFRVDEKATKAKLTANVGQAAALDHLEWLERQADGGTRVPRGEHLAVPVNAEAKRTGSGEIRKALKPRNIKRKYFREGSGGKLLLFTVKGRGKNSTSELSYVLPTAAPIAPIFHFYRDAERKGIEVFSDFFDVEFTKAIQSSRFFPA